MNNSSSDYMMTKSPLMTNPNANANKSTSAINFKCFHIKNKPSLQNQQTLSIVNKNNLRTMNKTMPGKQLNRRIIDSLNISSNLNANEAKYNKANQFNHNTIGNINANANTKTNSHKKQFESEETGILNQELQSSNNIITSLQYIITSLSQKIEQMEHDNINLTEYYKENISNLQTETETIQNEINDIAEANNSDILAELEKVTDEESKLKAILNEKEEDNSSLEEEIKSVLIEIEKQKEQLPSINSYYKSIIKKKEEQISYLTELNKGTLLLFNSKKYLLPKSKMTSLTALLRIQLSLMPTKIKRDDFIVYLLDKTNLESELTCPDIANRLLQKINCDNSNVSSSEYDNEMIQGYIETLFLQEEQSYCDINYMNEKLSVLLNDIVYYTEDNYGKYLKSFTTLFKPKIKRLEELLQSKDKKHKGIISYVKFGDILKTLQIKLTEDQLNFILFIMKSKWDNQLSILDLNYFNLLLFLNPKPAKKVDNYISRIKEHLNKEHTSISNFVGKLKAKIQMISEQRYIENEDMNNYLKETGILNDNEELDKDNTPELINVDFLVNLFEQQAEDIDNENNEAYNNSNNENENENDYDENFAYNEQILSDYAHKMINEILTEALNEESKNEFN